MKESACVKKKERKKSLFYFILNKNRVGPKGEMAYM